MAHQLYAPRVLLVDDEALIRWSLGEMLVERGYAVAEAANAADALRLAAGVPGFEIILLDLRLPDSTDLGLLERLRAVSPASHIIVMTAYGTPEIAARCERLGASNYVGKPFMLNDVVALVQRVA
jgi:DNA-binding NtrC family response regulator